ncbi:MAG: branched-chain amino acid ABC transporter permease [Burkholderiales bacterium]
MSVVLAQSIANGVMLGSLYGLVAAGLALIFGVVGVPQFALGAFAMVGAYATYFCTTALGLNYWIALVIAGGFVGIVGVAVHAAVFRPMEKGPGVNMFIAAFGVLLMLQSLAILIFGTRYFRVAPPIGGSISFGGVFLTPQRLIVIIVALALIVSLHVLIMRTRLGACIRAVSDNPAGAAIVGINVGAVGLATMAIGSAMAGIAGGLIAPIGQVFPAMGDLLVIKAFVVVVLAGMGSIRGALISGYALGLAESLGGMYVSLAYQDAMAFVLLLLVLLLRPNGLFGKANGAGLT